MNRFILPLLLAGFLAMPAIPAAAQEENKPKVVHYYPVVKSRLDGERFEILIPRDDTSRTIYRFDKYTGEVWELDSELFRDIELLHLPREASEKDLAEDGIVNYQFIATSPYQVYVINLHTGVMWRRYDEGSLFKAKLKLKLIEEKP